MSLRKKVRAAYLAKQGQRPQQQPQPQPTPDILYFREQTETVRPRHRPNTTKKTLELLRRLKKY